MKTAKAPLLNSFNQKQLSGIILNPPHAIIIYGDQTGSALEVAEYLASEIRSENNLSKGEQYAVGANDEIPSIDDIRQIKSVTRSKNTNAGTSRIILIGNSSKIKAEGQNALLKMLEEPVPGTVYILAANNAGGILSTIKSRCSEVVLRRPGVVEVVDYYNGAYTEAQLKSALSALSDLSRLDMYLSGEDPSMQYAKQVFAFSKFERLSLINDIAKDRLKAQELVQNLQVLLKYLYRKSVSTNQNSSKQKYRSSLEVSLEVSDALGRNGSVKLNLIRLFTAM